MLQYQNLVPTMIIYSYRKDKTNWKICLTHLVLKMIINK